MHKDLLNSWDLSRHGDALEVTAAQWIRANLSNYEIIWRVFIGHKNGRLSDILNSSPEFEIKRQHFSEYHFTILESLYFMHWLRDRQAFRKVENFDEYISVLTSLTSFLAYAGRVRDAFEKMCLALELKTLSQEGKRRLGSFYFQRNIFLHERKIPFNIDEDSCLRIAKPKTSDYDKGFGEKMLWKDTEEIINADVYMDEFCRSLNNEMNILLDLVAQEVKKIIKEKNLFLPPPPIRPIDEYYFYSSGITHLPEYG